MREIEIQLKNGAELIYFIRRDIEIRGEWLYVFAGVYSEENSRLIKGVDVAIRLSEVVYYEIT
jgi:hypothetical protein